MWWIILLIIVVIIVISLNSGDKNKGKTVNKQPVLNSNNQNEMEKLTLKMVGFGVDAVTSLEMTPDEKLDILTQAAQSINENNDANAASKYLKKIAVDSYKKSITNFTDYNDLIKETMKNELEELQAGKTADTSVFKKLIEYSTEYRKLQLQKEIDSVEAEIKRIEDDVQVKVTGYFTNEDGDLSFSVAGTKFRTEEEIERIMKLGNAEELKLVPEPTNQYDSNAIAVYTSDDSLIGYVPKEMTELMRDNSGDLKQYRCIVIKITEHNPPFVNVRVEFI